MKAQRAVLENDEQQLLFDAAKAYLDVEQDHAIVELNRQNEADLQKQLNITKSRFTSGDLTKTDISQAESRLQAATFARLTPYDAPSIIPANAVFTAVNCSSASSISGVIGAFSPLAA